jgi:hypothetical protein
MHPPIVIHVDVIARVAEVLVWIAITNRTCGGQAEQQVGEIIAGAAYSNAVDDAACGGSVERPRAAAIRIGELIELEPPVITSETEAVCSPCPHERVADRDRLVAIQ